MRAKNAAAALAQDDDAQQRRACYQSCARLMDAYVRAVDRVTSMAAMEDDGEGIWVTKQHRAQIIAQFRKCIQTVDSSSPGRLIEQMLILFELTWYRPDTSISTEFSSSAEAYNVLTQQIMAGWQHSALATAHRNRQCDRVVFLKTERPDLLTITPPILSEFSQRPSKGWWEMADSRPDAHLAYNWPTTEIGSPVARGVIGMVPNQVLTDDPTEKDAVATYQSAQGDRSALHDDVQQTLAFGAPLNENHIIMGHGLLRSTLVGAALEELPWAVVVAAKDAFQPRPPVDDKPMSMRLFGAHVMKAWCKKHAPKPSVDQYWPAFQEAFHALAKPWAALLPDFLTSLLEKGGLAESYAPVTLLLGLLKLNTVVPLLECWLSPDETFPALAEDVAQLLVLYDMLVFLMQCLDSPTSPTWVDRYRNVVLDGPRIGMAVNLFLEELELVLPPWMRELRTAVHATLHTLGATPAIDPTILTPWITPVLTLHLLAIQARRPIYAKCCADYVHGITASTKTMSVRWTRQGRALGDPSCLRASVLESFSRVCMSGGAAVYSQLLVMSGKPLTWEKASAFCMRAALRGGLQRDDLTAIYQDAEETALGCGLPSDAQFSPLFEGNTGAAISAADWILTARGKLLFAELNEERPVFQWLTQLRAVLEAYGTTDAVRESAFLQATLKRPILQRAYDAQRRRLTAAITFDDKNTADESAVAYWPDQMFQDFTLAVDEHLAHNALSLWYELRRELYFLSQR